MNSRMKDEIIGKLDSQTLHRRWTTELNSLRQRQEQTNQQAQRIRDLQAFLAFLDPLRKYEFEWQAIPGFKGKLANELSVQTTTSEGGYRKHLLARILATLTGGSMSEPGHMCSRIKEAQLVCSDHGESWPYILDELVSRKLVRKSSSEELSLSSPGANLLEWAVSNVAAPHDKVPASTTQLYDRLGAEARKAVGIVKLGKIATTGESAESSDLRPYRPPDANIVADIRLPTWRRYPSNAQLRAYTCCTPVAEAKNAKPAIKSFSKISPKDLRLLVKTLMKQQPNAYGVLHLLIQKRLVGECVCTFRCAEEEPVTIWECTLSLPDIRVTLFSAFGRSQTLARTNAAVAVLDVIMKRD